MRPVTGSPISLVSVTQGHYDNREVQPHTRVRNRTHVQNWPSMICDVILWTKHETHSPENSRTETRGSHWEGHEDNRVWTINEQSPVVSNYWGDLVNLDTPWQWPTELYNWTCRRLKEWYPKFFFGYWLIWLLGSWSWLSKHLIIRQRVGLDYQALW